MNLRENLSKEKAWAHSILDDVRAALRILGEL